jgi:hypothetical protein
VREKLERIVRHQRDITWNVTLEGCRVYIAELFWEYAVVCIVEREIKEISFFNNRNDAVQYAEKFINKQVRGS